MIKTSFGKILLLGAAPAVFLASFALETLEAKPLPLSLQRTQSSSAQEKSYEPYHRRFETTAKEGVQSAEEKVAFQKPKMPLSKAYAYQTIATETAPSQDENPAMSHLNELVSEKEQVTVNASRGSVLKQIPPSKKADSSYQMIQTASTSHQKKKASSKPASQHRGQTKVKALEIGTLEQIQGESFHLSGDAQVFNLKGAMEEAVQTNPQIFSEYASKRALEHTVDQAKSGYYPKVDLKAGAGYEYTRRKFGTNNLNRGPVSGSVSQDRYDPSVSVRQMLFDGFETPRRVEKAERETKQQVLKVREIQELMAFRTADQYIAVRRFQRLLKTAKENVENHKKILGKVRALVKGGKATVADVHIVESRLFDAESAVRDIEGDLDSAIATFIEIVGKEPGALYNARFNPSLLPASLDEALKIAREKNRSLVLANATIDVAKADIDLSETPFYPTLHLEADGHRNFRVDAEAGNETQVTALAVARFNLFNGGKDTARKRELVERLTNANYRRDTELRRTEKEVRLSYAEMMSARRQAEALRGAVKGKARVRDVYLQQLDLGTRSFLDILDATHEWFLAKGSLVTADAAEDLSSARLLAAMGHLIDSFELTPAMGEVARKLDETPKASS